MQVPKIAQFESFDGGDRIYKGVHVKRVGRGMSRGTSQYSIQYRGGRVGISNPSTFVGVRNLINEELARGLTVDPSTGHLVHPKND